MEQSPLFTVSRPRPEASSRLFCFPHAGGGPTAFFDWSGPLGEEIECVCPQYRGRGRRLREKPFESVVEMVGEIAAGLAAWLDRPFAFYGHSLGAIVAFELTRELRRSRLPAPHHLFVGAARPPHLGPLFAPIHGLADAEFVAKVRSRYGGIPDAVANDPEVLQMFLPALRADMTAFETYRFAPGDPLGLPISVFAGAEDLVATPQMLEEWALHTTSGFNMTILPGGHFFPGLSGRDLIRALRCGAAAHVNSRESSIAS